MALRDYQKTVRAQVRHAFTVDGAAPSLPAGAGKTVVSLYVRRPVVLSNHCDYCGALVDTQHRGGCPEVVR